MRCKCAKVGKVGPLDQHRGITLAGIGNARKIALLTIATLGMMRGPGRPAV
jgi:hypothetical protein